MVRIDPMVKQIVGRCHVGDSNLTAIRYFVSRLRDGRRTFFSMARRTRRKYLRQVIECHRRNRELYSYVVRGGR